MNAIAEAFVDIRPNTQGFGTRVKRQVERELDRLDIQPIRIPPLVIAIGDVAASGIAALTSLIGQLGAGAVAITSQVASATSSIVALGAAAGRTASLIATVPTALASIGLVMGTVRLATHGLVDAIDAVIAGGASAAAGLKSLPPSAREFALAVAQLNPLLQALRETAAAGLFPGVTASMLSILTLFPDVRSAVGATASIMGELARQVGRLVAGPLGPDLRAVLIVAVDLIRIAATTASGLVTAFVKATAAAAPLARIMTQDLATGINAASKAITRIVSGSGFVEFLNQSYASLRVLLSILGNLGIGLSQVFLGAIAAGDDLFRSIRGLTEQFREFATSAKGRANISAFFTRSAKSAKLLGSLLGNALRIIIDIGKAALPAGTLLVESLRRASDQLRNFTSSATGQNQIRNYFLGIVPVVEEFGRLIRDVTGALIYFSSLPGNMELLAQIRTQLLPAFVSLFETLSDTRILKAFIDFLTALVGVVDAVAQHSQTAVAILKTFASGLDALAAIVSVPFIGSFIQLATAVVGVGAAFRLMAGFSLGALGALGPLGVAAVVAATQFDTLKSGVDDFLSGFRNARDDISSGITSSGDEDNAASLSFWERLGSRAGEAFARIRSSILSSNGTLNDFGQALSNFVKGQFFAGGVHLSDALGLDAQSQGRMLGIFASIEQAIEGVRSALSGNFRAASGAFASALGLDESGARDIELRLDNLREGISAFFKGNLFPAAADISVALGLSPEAQGKVLRVVDTIERAISGLRAVVFGGNQRDAAGQLSLLGFDPDTAETLVEGFNAAKSIIVQLFTDIAGAIKRFAGDNPGAVFSGIAAAVAVLAAPALLTAVTAIVGVVGSVGTVVATVAAAFVSLPVIIGAVVTALIYAYQHFEEFRTIVDTVFTFIRTIVGDVVAFLAIKFAEILVFVNEIWPQIQEAISHVINVIVGIIKVGLAVVVEVWKVVGDDIMRIVSAVFGTIKEIISAALQIVMNIIRLGLAVINGDWGKAWDALRGIVGGVWDAIFGIVRGAINILVGILGGAYDLLKTALGASIGAITDTFKDAGTWLLDAGKKIIQGLIDGVDAMLGPLDEIAGKAAGVIADHFPGSPVKKGPLSGRHEPRLLGKAVGSAIATGLLDTSDLVGTALGSLLTVPDINAPGFVGSGRGAASTAAPGVVQNFNLTVQSNYESEATPEENFRRMELLAGV
jgi:phage-related protein